LRVAAIRCYLHPTIAEVHLPKLLHHLGLQDCEISILDALLPLVHTSIQTGRRQLVIGDHAHCDTGFIYLVG
jgi:hypothetical protein